MAPATLELCTFVVADLHLGVDADQVQEVVRHQVITPLPLAPPEIAGLLNLRGQVVTAIDLRGRLGLGPRPDGQLPPHLIVRGARGPASLLVDQISDVLACSPDELEPPPTTVDETVRGFLGGVCTRPERLLLLLDLPKVLAVGAQAG
jgi:purine-binding chemotaxis protein CheW